MHPLLFTALLAASCSVSGAALEYAGCLGQSQEESASPVPYTAVYSAAGDSSNLYFITGPYPGAGELWRLPHGSRTAEKVRGATGGTLLSDGTNLYLVEGRYVFKLENGVRQEKPLLDMKRTYDRVVVANAQAKAGFGAAAKFFAYDRKAKKVDAWKADGTMLPTVLDLGKTASRSPFYSLGYHAESGSLIASTGYPELRTYRFTPDGAKQSGNWPLRGSASAFFNLDGVCWGVEAGATTFRSHPVSGGRERIGGESDRYTYAIAGDGGDGFFLATSQGLKHYARENLSECDFRIGGLPGISALALSKGRVIAVCDGAIHSMLLDDSQSAPLQNAGNEAWRVGANWASRGVAVQPGENAVFLILDRTKKGVWRFDPSRTAWGDAARFRFEGGKFRAPDDMAFRDGSVIVADAGRLNVKNDLAEPVTRVDIFPSGEIVAANTGNVFFLKDGKTLWRFSGKVADIAVLEDFIAVSGEKLLLLDRNGKVVTEKDFRLTALAAEGRWLIGASPERKGILRFKLNREKE